MPFGGLLSAGIGAAGSLIGGIAGNEAGRGARGEANNRRNDANTMIQELQNAPSQARPLILEKYRQAGLLTPEMESEVSAGLSKMEGVKTDGLGVEAQKAALKQMQERANTGMTATDRAALAKAQSDANVEGNAKQQQIMQQFAQRGQGGQGAQLAAQLAEQQGGANRASQNALDIMGKSQQQALQAAAQSGQMGSNYEQQQFGEQSAKAQAADEMNRFNTQLRAGTQQRNVGATNQAQAGNLSNQQSLMNSNTQNANQELLRQRQGEQQDYANKVNLAGMKANAMTGQAQNLQAQGDQAAASQQALFGGLGQAIGGGVGSYFTGKKQDAKDAQNQKNIEAGYYKPQFNQGGPVHNFKGGGHVPGQAEHEGDHPENDTVEAVLSPGEIVVPRSLAQTSLGDKLLDLLKSHHEIKTHLDGIEKKANKPKKQKFVDGGMSQPMQQPPMNINENAMQFGKVVDKLKAAHPDLPEEELFRAAHAVQQKIGQAQMAPPAPQEQPQAPAPNLGQQIGNQIQLGKDRMAGMAHGGEVPQRGTVEYLQHLMSQLKKPKAQYYDEPAKVGSEEDSNFSPSIEIDEPSIIRQTPNSDNDIVNAFESEMPVEDNMSKQPESMVKSKNIESKSPDMALEEQNGSESDLFESKALDKKPMSQYDSRDSEKFNTDSSTGDTSLDSEDDEKSSDEEPLKDMMVKSAGVDTSSDALKRAQSEREGNSYLRQIQEGAALAGSGISKTDPSKMIDLIRQQKDRMDLPVKSFQEQVANQANDPASQKSQITRDYLKQKYSMNIPDNASYSDIEKVAGFALKDSALQNKLKLAEDKRKFDEQQFEKSEEGKDRRAKIASEGKLEDKQSRAEEKKIKAFDDSKVKAENDIQRAKSRGSVTRAYNTVNSANTALELVRQFPDIDNWSPEQVHLFNTEVSRMAKGGNASPTEGETKEISSPTIASKWAKLSELVGNKPKGAKQKDFVMNSIKYIRGIKDVANNVISQSVTPVIDAYKNKLKPEDYQDLQSTHAAHYRPISDEDKKAVQAYVKMPNGPKKDELGQILENKGLL